MSEPLLIATGLNTYYGQSHVLHDISFSLLRGETLGLMGRNGMGKSTLLKSLLNIVPPKTGSVTFAGRECKALAPYEISRLGVAYVPEGRGIFANLSVRENLTMAARAGKDGKLAWTLERVLTSFPRLAERINHGGQQLSGGEQQMLSIGRALMTNPELLILDEATEGLAPLIARDIWRIIGVIKATGISTIIVDKSWRQVSSISDRNLILVKGVVVFNDDTKALLAQPELLQQHLGV